MPEKPLNQQNNMPKVGGAFGSWNSPISLVVISTTNQSGFVSLSGETRTGRGTVQPLSARQLSLKPEGQRAFTWLQIHDFSRKLNLNTNDRIQYNGVTYKVMALKDYTLNGYMEYHVIEDYQGVVGSSIFDTFVITDDQGNALQTDVTNQVLEVA